MENKLRILQIAHPNVPILAKSGGYGGLEEVVEVLDRRYAQMGHKSFVVASSDSDVSGTLLPTIPSLYGPGRGHMKADVDHISRGFTEHARKTWEHIKEVQPDVIHDHTGYHRERSVSERLFDTSKGLRTAKEIEAGGIPPVLITLHGYLNEENREMYEGFEELFRDQGVHFSAVSQFQRAAFRGTVDVDSVVLNAIDVDSYEYGGEGAGYVFSMGSIYRGKGTHVAIDTALKLGKKLILAGPYFHNAKYWEERLRPKVDRVELGVPADQLRDLAREFVESDDNVLYVGELGAREKRKLYTGADAFYFPVTIDETFGLVSAEANASGVPVVSYLSGGVPEVVKNGVSGFTVRRGDEQQFIRAASRAGELSRQDCRAWAEENFRVERQASDYMGVYRDMCQNSNGRGQG